MDIGKQFERMSIEFGISEHDIYSLEGNINFFAHLLRFSKFQFDIPAIIE
jgi:hypothetical protein